MRREQAKSIKELMPLFIQEMGFEKGLNGVRALALWDELIGPVAVAAIEKREIKRGKLYAKINSSVVRNWLFIRRTNILEKINEVMGKNLVTEIVLY